MPSHDALRERRPGRAHRNPASRDGSRHGGDEALPVKPLAAMAAPTAAPISTNSGFHLHRRWFAYNSVPLRISRAMLK